MILSERTIIKVLSEAAVRSLDFQVFATQNDYQIAIEHLTEVFATHLKCNEQEFGQTVWTAAHEKHNAEMRVILEERNQR